MRHHQHPLPGMGCCDLQHSLRDSRRQALETLARGSSEPDVRGQSSFRGELLLDLLPGEAREDANVGFSELGSGRHREAHSGGDDLRRLHSPREVTRVHGSEGRRREPLGKLARLCPTNLVERRVGVPLEAPVAVPVGLSVPRQQDRRRHGGYGSRMPILEVTALPQGLNVDVGAVASALTRAVATALGEEARGTWVVWRTVKPGHYVEGAEAAVVQPVDTHPPSCA